MTHDRRVLLMALLAGLPGSLLALGLLWFGDHTPKVQWTCTVLVVGLWWSFAFALQGTVVRPLQTLSNLLAALREEDFSFRARGGRGEDSLGDAMREVNALAETLRQQRLGALEATALLRKVMEEIDVAVFAFDAERRLRLVNRSGQRLLGRAEEQLLGRQADELGLSGALATAPRVLELSFPGAAGRWEARRGTFRQAGLPLQLLVLSDVSRALREEERQAWQRLIRVLGHELNNSLAPIRSIAGSLEALVDREPRPTDWQADMRRGLGIITARSDALSRFMEAYARLARLPPPQLGPVAIGPLVRRVAGLETRVEVAVRPGPELTVRADGDQLEQLLINLLWSAPNGARSLEVWVEDEGPGLPNTANLFVPFFTTKPHGSGIGLVLSRQIAEAHGGVLTLDNRHPGPGCRAHLRLPL